jgi:hypothetical protein
MFIRSSWRSRRKKRSRFYNLTTEFTVIPAGEGSILQVTQDGFPAGSVADSFYAACEKGWGDTFESIKRYFAESRRGGSGAGGFTS